MQSSGYAKHDRIMMTRQVHRCPLGKAQGHKTVGTDDRDDQSLAADTDSAELSPPGPRREVSWDTDKIEAREKRDNGYLRGD